MPQPYNYNLNVPNPAASLAQGLQLGVGIRDQQAQTALRDQQIQAAQTKQQRSRQFQQALGSLGANPSSKQLTGLLVQFPEMADMYKESYGRLADEEKRERVSQASSIYAATLAGDNDLALKQLNEYATAYRNAGREQDAKALEAQAKLIELNPEAAEKGISLFLASALGPEKFAEAFEKTQEQRRKTALEKSELTIKERQAEQEAVKSKFAEQLADSGLRLNEAQIRNLAMEPEIKRANLKLLTLQTQYAKESNELKKQELAGKIEDAKLAREEKARTRISDAQAGAADVDNALNTAQKILNLPTGFFSPIRRATGPVADKSPTLSPGSAQVEELVNTLKSQSFLTQVKKLSGFGALSNQEGAKLEAALANLSLRGGADFLIENVTEVQRLLTIMRQGLSTKYGVPLSTPDTPAAALDPNGEELDALVRGAQTGGATARY